MRLNILVAASLLFTLVSGLAIPSDSLYERDTDLEVREALLEDNLDLVTRQPGLKSIINRFKPKYTVKAGGGKPAQTYKRKEVKKAVKDANAERTRLQTASNRQKKLSPLKKFNNNNHRQPRPGSGKKSLPRMKGTGFEYPLPNKAPGATGKGPARVIMQPNRNGKLKLKGVVAHDQSRTSGAGQNDHFKVKGRINPFKKRK
ncbi:hypothetical protein FA15DRAFT_702984 [Coprinopsis marcescibilis]|uniref:Uncharacterized protein n=1 Tax=Coprinopsis marcescibilis TaxID=230819 RepID=A0A5C3L0X9_COPMA|nr:hypothetical protein FA15DRAFT_702984 [Coprinopsis marcescibilis]